MIIDVDTPACAYPVLEEVGLVAANEHQPVAASGSRGEDAEMQRYRMQGRYARNGAFNVGVYVAGGGGGMGLRMAMQRAVKKA